MMPRGAVLALLGILIGTWSTLVGIGGGIFAVPILHFVYGMELRKAVANSLWLVAASTSAATIAEIAHPDTVLNARVLFTLVPFSLLGTLGGYRVAVRIDARRLKLVFVVLLAAVAFKILVAAPAPALAATRAAGAELEMTLREHAIVAAVGLAAGFLAPLLGIGGGLVAVPGLFLGIPAIGFATARACSTAMSAFNGVQSVWMYRVQRLAHGPTAAWLAGGALAGGLVGDWLVHFDTVVAVAQKLLAVTLLLAAARFAWDVARGPSAAARS